MSPSGFTPTEQAEIADLVHDLGSDAGPRLREIAARDPGAHRLLVAAILRVDGELWLEDDVTPAQGVRLPR
jgi:hypothetical protein